MPLTFQAIFTTKDPTYSLVPLFRTHFPKPSNCPFSPPISTTRIPNPIFLTSLNHISPVGKIKASIDETYGGLHGQADATSKGFNFDDFLSSLEFLSLGSSAAISLYVALSCGVLKGDVLGWVGSRIFAWQCVFLVTSVLVGAAIRRRQWRRVCGAGFSRGSASYGADLLGRVEKVEGDLRSSATLIRVLSRQLEKLGDRVRATRKALKEPIAETAALAQKNSEVTRALAAQEDVLQKELVEIQNVLLAMQEQQQKQLELILAIGKAGKLWDSKLDQTKDNNTSKTVKSSVDGESNLGINQNKTLGAAKASQQGQSLGFSADTLDR